MSLRFIPPESCRAVFFRASKRPQKVKSSSEDVVVHLALLGQEIHDLLVAFDERCGRCGDIDGPAEDLGHGGRGRAHHLVHDLAGGAHAHVVELEAVVRLRELVAHQQIEDNAHVVSAENDYVRAGNALDIADDDDDGGLQIGGIDVVELALLDARRRNDDLTLKHCGNGGGRRAHADVHDLADCVYFFRR